MRLNEITYTDAKPIDGYGDGFFRIDGVVHHGPICVGPDGIATWGGFSDSDTLLALEGAVDVLFVGTGQDIAPIPDGLRLSLEDAGLGVETMASPAACRTYNILLSEGRRIALALIPV